MLYTLSLELKDGTQQRYDGVRYTDYSGNFIIVPIGIDTLEKGMMSGTPKEKIVIPFENILSFKLSDSQPI